MTRRDFQEWLDHNRDHLRTYQPHEVALIAAYVGFKPLDVTPELSDWLSTSERKLRLWSNPLMEHWLDLMAYQNRGVEWD